MPIEIPAGGVRVTRREGSIREQRPALHIPGIQPDGLAERIGRLHLTSFLEQVGVQIAKTGRGASRVARLRHDASGSRTRGDIRRVDRPQKNDDLGRTLHVSPLAPAGFDDTVIRLRVFQQPEARRDVGQPHLRGFFVRNQLQDLFVERCRLGVEAVLEEVIGDAARTGRRP